MLTNYNPKIALKIGQKIDLYHLVTKLLNLGFSRVEEITLPGQFSVVGGTVTIYPVNYIFTIRIEFFANIVERIFGIKQNHKKSYKEIELEPNLFKLSSGETIRPEKYVVHLDHGIGIFKCLGMKTVSGKIKQYIFLEYLNNSFLYLPITLKEKITSYIGVGQRKPKLNKLGSGAWQRTKKRAYESILALTKELLIIYAKREIVHRDPYKIDQSWDQEIRKSFQFRETPDQEKAIQSVEQDLRKNVPMDRLICGDVGYGKTEIAIRAAVQALANGHQAALLCPTTILAEQHFATFESRLKGLPVKTAKLSRFLNKKNQKEVLAGLENGTVDFVVGTHRLLSRDIKFKTLDLIVIDEEQRFGVKQKEKFKKMREKVNVLTLSATPIPRTLFMALSGIRDISEINTPPKGRRAILTEVKKENDSDVEVYIKRELNRTGQIYYLHNQIDTIEAKAAQLRQKFPASKIAVAHGQMEESALAETMSQFAVGKIDILVCSTIIENGLDLPNINTLIVDHADYFGLAQLYQIRGRIGRSERQAYCLLMYNSKKLSPEAYKRLKSLVENSQLGSGFNIALSDLEIRGGGNILGREQHGTMETVGLVLYTKLLKQAVDKLKK